jgi:replicative DNA helicase
MGQNDDDVRLAKGEISSPLDGTVQTNKPTMHSADGEPAKPPPLRSVLELAKLSFETMQARKSGAEKPIALPASWHQYRQIMGGGMWPGLHVLVAGTGAGKTTFATQIALEAASNGHPTAYVGLELDETQVGLRMLGAQAKVQWSKLYLGQYDEKDLKDTLNAIAVIESGKWPLFADFGATTGWPASRIATIAQELKTKSDKSPLIILDFLQLVGSEQGEKLDLRERIGRAAYLCRQVAREHKAAVLVVSSSGRNNYGLLSGDNEKSGPGFKVANEKDEEGNDWLIGRMKNPDSLVGVGKESGEIEYAADSVTVLVKDQDFKGEGQAEGQGFYVAVPKLRYGRPGYCSMSMEQCRFEECEPREPPAPTSGRAGLSGRDKEIPSISTVARLERRGRK